MYSIVSSRLVGTNDGHYTQRLNHHTQRLCTILIFIRLSSISGPCPPCQAMVTRNCNCGKSSKMYQCNQRDVVECSEICDKPLNCGVHRCEKPCHVGDCDTCDIELEQMCYCTRDKRTVPCTQRTNKSVVFSCGRVCNSILQCKNHKCKEICHIGECGSCKFAPASVKTCPCGKMPIQKDLRKTCKDPVPVCEKNCGKKMSCGQPNNPHSCSSTVISSKNPQIWSIF